MIHDGRDTAAHARDGGPDTAEWRLRSLGVDFEVPTEESLEIVVVDDDGVSLSLLVAHLERLGFPVHSFQDSQEALEAIRASPPQLLVTDMVMPGLTGVDLARHARAVDPDIGVILVTGVGNEQTAEATVRLGISSYLIKPVERDALSREVQRAFVRRIVNQHSRELLNWMYESMARNAEEIRNVTVGALTSLANAMDARHPHFKGHSHAVAMQAAAVADRMGLTSNDVEQVRVAGLLHDIGMIGVPDAVIQKPGALTPEEMLVVQRHCQVGAEIIAPIKQLDGSQRYVMEHHERWDGSGYPGAKRGDEISIGGQIVGIAECWAAMLEARAYRDGRSREAGLELLLEHKGVWFSEDVTVALRDSDIGLM